MSNFEVFVSKMQKHFEAMTQGITILYETAVDKEELWNLYLDSFPEETNNLFRKRREYDCSCCRHFIKTIGNVVVLKENKLTSLWDFETGDSTYQPVADAMSRYIKSHAVTDVYVACARRIGTKHNFEQLEDGRVIQWDHLYLDLPDRLLNTSSRSEGDIKGGYRDTRNVFKRSLSEITTESVNVVLELISQNSLYRGEEWKEVLSKFLKYKTAFEALSSDEEKENYAWEKSVKAGGAVGRIRNHSIGTLLLNISEGMDLDTAVKKYEEIVAGPNYKRPNPIYSKRQLDELKEYLTENGYMDSLSRRFATLDDISVNDILFSNRDSAKRINGADVFEEMLSAAPVNPKKFSHVEEISIEKFISDVLPNTTELEAFLENRHINSMASLIAPVSRDSKTMFKWNNGFSWTYSGNVADSIREHVKAAGGRVDGVLRFSIQWNDLDYDRNDLDAHCGEPTGEHIYFDSDARKPGRSRLGGQLDVDIMNPDKGVPAVENITWPDKAKMKPGVYRFWVHNYAHRGGRRGFRAEIEFDGKVYSFDYANDVKQDVQVAEVTLHADGTFSIKELLPSNVSSRDVWNLKTNQFVPVSIVMYSPNYWEGQGGVGHRHYMFMLKDCINPECPNAFYNEFLKEDFMKYRRALEALGGKLAVTAADDQLSGLGFSSTIRNELIVKVKGQTERMLKIKF